MKKSVKSRSSYFEFIFNPQVVLGDQNNVNASRFLPLYNRHLIVFAPLQVQNVQRQWSNNFKLFSTVTYELPQMTSKYPDFFLLFLHKIKHLTKRF